LEESAIEEEKEEEVMTAEGPARYEDDLELLLAGNLTANLTEEEEFLNVTDTADISAPLFDDYNGDNWNSSNITLWDNVTEDDIPGEDDMLYMPTMNPALFISLDNTTDEGLAENDTELYDDFLIDTSDNDTADGDFNGTVWAAVEEDEASLFGQEEDSSGEEEAEAGGSMGFVSSDLETNVERSLGSQCVA
jgi:hypothetical protein